MTRLFMTVLTALMVMGAGTAVYAGDEFGSRFGGDTPNALKADKTDSDVKPQDVEPAAGEEATKTEDGRADESNDTSINPVTGAAPVKSEDAPAKGDTNNDD